MVEINNTTRTKVDEKLVKRVVASFLQEFNLKNKDVSVAFVGEYKIKVLNKAYRGVDRVTDILSFYGDGHDLGELVICNAKIIRQGPKFGHTPRQELIFIIVHGLLHLIGENDDTEKKRLAMIAHGERIIKKLNLK